MTARADLHGCETWSLILRQEHRLRVSEGALRRVYGPLRGQVAPIGRTELHVGVSLAFKYDGDHSQ
jgi:hypothetical protein